MTRNQIRIVPDPEIDKILGVTTSPRSAGVELDADELGDLIGVSSRHVMSLAADGVIPRLRPGRFDRRAAVRGYCADLRSKATGRSTTNPEYTAAKTRLAAEQAQKVATGNALAAGDLVKAADVAATWAGIVGDVRAALLAVPSRVTGLDRKAVVALDREIRTALEALSDGG